MDFVKELLLLQVDGTPGFPPRGVAGLGVIVRDLHGRVYCSRALRAPARTSNEAEYQALIAGLDLVLRRYPGAPIRCLTDSRLVVDQLSGRAAVRGLGIRPLYLRAAELAAQFAHLELVAIPRELNRLADALAWEALGGRQSLVKRLPADVTSVDTSHTKGDHS